MIEVNTTMKSEVIDEIIKECDKNNDGVIDFSEFLNSISQLWSSVWSFDKSESNITYIAIFSQI